MIAARLPPRALPGLAAALLLAGAGFAGQGGSTDTYVNVSGDEFECGRSQVRYGGRAAYTAEETLTIPRSDLGTLRVRLAGGSGVAVRGADRGDYAVTACKAAREASLLEEIGVTVGSGGIAVRGLDDNREGMVRLLIEAPRDAAVDLETANGPLSVTGISGKVSAAAHNGPVAIRDCTGDVQATTHNGPISFTGGGRDVALEARNGPISVELAGRSWEGRSLEASTRNGPLSVKLPSAFSTGVEIEVSGLAPLSCRHPACEGASRSGGDQTRRLRFGDGPIQVRLSTRNGPVAIGPPDGEL